MARANGRDVARALEAARGGDIETLRLLTTGRKAASAPLVLGEALRAAAESGHVDALKALLQLGAPAAGAPWANKDRTPLARACAGGHAECAAALMAHGALAGNIEVAAALRGDHSGCLRAIVTSRSSSWDPQYPTFLLSTAAGYGALACMDELCRPGCDSYTVGSADGTPLRAASAIGNTRGVAWLLEHGAPIDAAPQPGGATALFLACTLGNVSCARLLLRYGASVDLADSNGETPLDVALSGEHAACAALLLDHGARAAADCFARAGFIRDAACWNLVPRLLAAGVDANCPDQHGFRPLALAVEYGAPAAVRALCAAGADAWAAGDISPLHWVASLFHDIILDWDFAEEPLPGRIENALACADELIERVGAETLLATVGVQAHTALELGLISLADAAFDGDVDSSVLQQLRDGCLAPLLARWPLSAPLPEYDGVGALLPAAAGHAQRRHEVLRISLDDITGRQQALTAAFLRRVRDACGGAVALSHVPFARFRFAAGGGLERAWAMEREVHRFPVERVALSRAALQVASDAQAAAAERCVPLLRELSAACSSSSSSREAGKLRYAAAVAVGRWGAIRAAVSRAKEGVGSSEAALDAAVDEAEAQVGRLLLAKAAAEAVAAARAAAPAASG